MKPQSFNRRRFLATAGAGSAWAGLPIEAAESRLTRGIVDCQSHLFVPEVLNLMRGRKTEPLVYDQEGTTFLRMGDWLRKVTPIYIDVDVKLAAMAASGIEIAMSTTSSPCSSAAHRTFSASPASICDPSTWTSSRRCPRR